jgi:hypothetical protein
LKKIPEFFEFFFDFWKLRNHIISDKSFQNSVKFLHQKKGWSHLRSFFLFSEFPEVGIIGNSPPEE